MALLFDEETFEAEVLDSDLPVLVDFYTDWCGPCKMMAPVLEELAAEYDGRLIVGKVNAETEPELAREYGISSVPTLILFRGGEAIERMVGFRSKQHLKEMLKSL